jgi:glycosyltransferase involved in cell wall biosynthesis
MVRYVAKRDPRIEFLGLVDHERVMHEYARADLLVNLRLTSNQTHRYVFPSKVVECLSTGVPLLSTRTGHIESEFGGFVYLLDEQTPEALAAKLSEIKSVPRESRREFGASAQRYVLQEKTWEAQVKKIETYLREDVFKEAA